MNNNKKGEKMSLRKGISLLLLVAFVLTAVPAQASVWLNASVTSYPTLAQDAGRRADGANQDTIPLQLEIKFNGSGSLTFGNDGTALFNGDIVYAEANGKLAVANGTGLNHTPTLNAHRVAIFVPPTGTKFVKLNANQYQDTTIPKGTAGAFTFQNGAPATLTNNIFKNVVISSSTNDLFPDSDATNSQGDIRNAVLATVTEAALSSFYGASASTAAPAGSLILHFVTDENSPAVSSGNTGFITVNGIGLAADGTSDTALGTSGDLNITYKTVEGLGASSSNALSAFDIVDIANNATTKVGTLAAPASKLEMILLGEKTGTETSGTAEPDNQPNVAFASQITGTTVGIGPGHVTSAGSTTNIDTDAILIRATERLDSTSSSRKYFETPFNTSKFVTTSGHVTASVLSNGPTNATVLRDIQLTNSSTFANTSNALITLTFSLRTVAGGTSTATLALNAASLSLIGERGFTGFNRSQTATLTTGTANKPGFLGSYMNPEVRSNTAGDYAIGWLYNGTAAATTYNVKDNMPADYAVQATKHGLAAGATLNPVAAVNGASLTATSVNPALGGVFPGSMVLDDSGAATGTWFLVNTATTSGSANFSLTKTGNTNIANGEFIQDPSQMTVRLINGTAGASIGNAAWLVGVGNDAAGADNVLTGNGGVQVASSNLNDTTIAYDNGWVAKATAGDNVSASNSANNNAFMVAELDGAIMRILPLLNRFDGLRDVIAVRPEATITLNDQAKTDGVEFIVTATGNNLPASGVTKVLARILPSNSVVAGMSAKVVPAHGTITTPGLMRYKASTPGTDRAVVLLSSVTGASTSTDSITDIVGTGNVLDETVPPLFCGGTAGTASKGPNGVVFQPKARAVLVTEASTTGFQDAADLGTNTRLRITLPTGMDLNAYSATATKFLAIANTGGFSVAPTIDRVQPVASGITQAFVDINLGTTTGTTVSTLRSLALFFKPNALVAPSGQASFGATVTIINTNGTNTLNASITDDVLLSTVGTVQLAGACSQFLAVSYCDDVLSSFQNSGTTSTIVEDTFVSNGALRTTFSAAPGYAGRLISSTSAANDLTLPDLCIEEGVADALPIGTANDGVPSIFGEEALTSPGTVVLHLATSQATSSATGKVGFIGTAPTLANIKTSDASIRPTATNFVAGNDTNNNEMTVTLAEGSVAARKRPFEEKTTIRIPGLVVDGATNSSVPSSQDILAWVEVVGANSSQYAVGSNAVRATENINTSTNEHFLSNAVVTAGNSEDEAMSNFYSDRVQDTTTGTVVITDWGDADTTTATNDVSVAVTGGGLDKLANGVRTFLDDNNFKKLSSSTQFSVQLSNISGATDKEVTVSAAAGSLQPGTTINVTTSGTVDSINNVAVLADGSFIAKVRATTSQQVTLTQVPPSALSGPPQTVVLDVEEQNVEPKITSASVDDILGTVTEKGKSVVVFTVNAVGRLNSVNYVPTADNLKLGNNSVIAVDGTTDTFMGIVDFSKANGKTLTSTADGTTSSVTIDVSTDNPTLAGAPDITKVKTNKKGKVVVTGRGLRSNGLFGFVLSDGTFSPLDLGKPLKGIKQTSESTDGIPSDAVFGVYRVPGRGVDAIEL
jgi:hypothetical protein